MLVWPPNRCTCGPLGPGAISLHHRRHALDLVQEKGAAVSKLDLARFDLNAPVNAPLFVTEKFALQKRLRGVSQLIITTRYERFITAITMAMHGTDRTVKPLRS